MRELVDGLGHRVRLPREVRRVVSLVPSLTETVGVSAPDLLVGITAYCTHPPGLPAAVVGGTKNPDLPTVLDLRPDVVLANEEENRPDDLDRLRAAGVAVWVTDVRTVPAALAALTGLHEACGLPQPEWLGAAEQAWAAVRPADGAGSRPAVVPIWRRPWMVLGRDTFAGDVLARLGVANVYADHPERYPKVELDRLRAAAGLVVLPDEPYRFGADDGPEAFPDQDCALVSGRHLTWYGPSMVEAPAVLAAQLAAARRYP